MKRLTQLAATLPYWLFALTLLLLLAARDSQNLLRPEFYAEDGSAWYAEAYRNGFASLALPRDGYFNSIQRLVAIAAQPLPLSCAPLAFNLFAYAAYAGLVLLLISPRLDEAWPQRGARRLFALLLVLMPAAHEVFGVLTNVQWVLAAFAFLVLASRPPAGWGGKLLDGTVLLASGASGPFCIVLVPFAAWRWWRAGGRPCAWRLALLLGTVALQLGCIYFFIGERPAAHALGASPGVLLQIVALIALMAEFGSKAVGLFAYTAFWHLQPLTGVVLGLGALLACAIGWRAATPLLRWFMLFAALMLAAALYKPTIDPRPEVLPWLVMVEHPPAGGRYYFFPLIAWWGMLFACATQAGLIRRLAQGLLALTCLIAIPLDWPVWHADHYDEFQAQARAFETAAPGTRFVIPIKPQDFAPLVLVKK